MKRILGGLVVLACGCGDVKPNHLADAPPVIDAAPDAVPIDAPPPRCDVTKSFGAPLAVTELNTTGDDFTPSLSADELTILFSSARAGGPGGGADIYLATRASKTGAFGTPSLIANVNTTGRDSRPMLTADGLTLYLEYQANPNSSYDVVKATRASTQATFSAPSAIAAIDTTSNDDAPDVTPDNGTIYFVSNRNGNNDIYSATGTNGAFGAASLVSGTNLAGASIEDYPVVSSDQKTLYFASDRAGGSGGADIWVATRTSLVTGFDAPVNVTALNTGGADSPGWISADGCVMYLNRNVGVAASNYDIYVATKPL